MRMEEQKKKRAWGKRSTCLAVRLHRLAVMTCFRQVAANAYASRDHVLQSTAVALASLDLTVQRLQIRVGNLLRCISDAAPVSQQIVVAWGSSKHMRHEPKKKKRSIRPVTAT